MTEVKICGITNGDDALCAAASGANALGFIFYPKSPRYVSPQKAREIINLLPFGVSRVGVFVNADADDVKRITDICGLDIIQLHGDESPEYCRAFPPESIVKSVFLSSLDGIAYLDGYHVRAFLADARHDGRYGGTGKTADWALAARAAAKYPLILAGGLNEKNIAAALAKAVPGAVDINSGIEISPGIKDHERMKRSIAIVKNTSLPAFVSKGIFPGSGLSARAF